MRDSKQIALSQREDGWCESLQGPVEPGSEHITE